MFPFGFLERMASFFSNVLKETKNYPYLILKYRKINCQELLKRNLLEVLHLVKKSGWLLMKHYNMQTFQMVLFCKDLMKSCLH